MLCKLHLRRPHRNTFHLAIRFWRVCSHQSTSRTEFVLFSLLPTFELGVKYDPFFKSRMCTFLWNRKKHSLVFILSSTFSSIVADRVLALVFEIFSWCHVCWDKKMVTARDETETNSHRWKCPMHNQCIKQESCVTVCLYFEPAPIFLFRLRVRMYVVKRSGSAGPL